MGGGPTERPVRRTRRRVLSKAGRTRIVPDSYGPHTSSPDPLTRPQQLSPKLACSFSVVSFSPTVRLVQYPILETHPGPKRPLSTVVGYRPLVVWAFSTASHTLVAQSAPLRRRMSSGSFDTWEKVGLHQGDITEATHPQPSGR